jgi:flagellar biosynthesis protein FlhG
MSNINFDMPTHGPDFQQIVGPKPVKVIAVSSGKGGVGKSQVAINLAVALAKKKKKVLLLDGDFTLPNLDTMLGLKSRYNLSHVVQGLCTLDDILLPGPDGITLIPGAFCNDYMTQLTPIQHAGIIDAFNELSGDWDYMIIDTATGLSEQVLSFTRSAQELLLVLCDEPASLTDTYAFIKLMNKRYQWEHFHILANMTLDNQDGHRVFHKLSTIAEQFLDVHLDYLGSIPFDRGLRKAIKRQQSIVSSVPDSMVTRTFRRLAGAVDEWPVKLTINANTSFFLERLVTG